MNNYPSDISREQFEIIRQDLENVKKRTRPRKYDLYDSWILERSFGDRRLWKNGERKLHISIQFTVLA